MYQSRLGLSRDERGRLKPGILIGRVIGDEIHNHADLPSPGFTNKTIEILHRAVLRIDRLVVGDVVPEIDLGRRVHRRDPDGIHAKIPQIVETGGNSIEVADTIAVGVLKAARINFINDRMLPPGGGESCAWHPKPATAARKRARTRSFVRWWAHTNVDRVSYEWARKYDPG